MPHGATSTGDKRPSLSPSGESQHSNLPAEKRISQQEALVFKILGNERLYMEYSGVVI